MKNTMAANTHKIQSVLKIKAKIRMDSFLLYQGRFEKRCSEETCIASVLKFEKNMLEYLNSFVTPRENIR